MGGGVFNWPAVFGVMSYLVTFCKKGGPDPMHFSVLLLLLIIRTSFCYNILLINNKCHYQQV